MQLKSVSRYLHFYDLKIIYIILLYYVHGNLELFYRQSCQFHVPQAVIAARRNVADFTEKN
jgi:hypothetical protein